MTTVDISLFNTGPLKQASHYRVQHGYRKTVPSVRPSDPAMSLDPRASHYPLFIEPHFIESPTQDDHLTSEPLRHNHEHSSSEPNPTRCILDKIKTIKLDTPALRRAQMAFQHPPRSSSLVRGAARPHGHTTPGAEPSAFSTTTARLQQAHTDLSPVTVIRSSSHARNQSLQQRRTQGALTIASPTARQARGRPAGPMIWLPDEQVWLLADSDAVANATSTGVAFPNSAPLSDAVRAESTERGRTRGGDQDGRARLHRSDSSPIRTQFLRLILKSDADTSFSAQDWTVGATSGPSAVEEDAIWYAEQQARTHSRRDQDRFSPMLQQALVGVDLPMDPESTGEYLAVPGGDEVWAAHAMRRSSTMGDIDNIAHVLANAQPRDRRTIAQRRSGSLRSRVSTVGNEDYMYDSTAALHARDLREGGYRRRHSDDDVQTSQTATEEENYNPEWLASLISQGVVLEGIFTPRASVADGAQDGAATPRGTRAGALDRQAANDASSPTMSAVSPVIGSLSRSPTSADEARLSRSRWMSVSTSAGDETRNSVDARDGGEVSPVSSRGRDSLYD